MGIRCRWVLLQDDRSNSIEMTGHDGGIIVSLATVIIPLFVSTFMSMDANARPLVGDFNEFQEVFMQGSVSKVTDARRRLFLTLK